MPGNFLAAVPVLAAIREDHRARTIAGMERLAAEGKRVGAIPYGYGLLSDGKTLGSVFKAGPTPSDIR